MTCLLAVGRNPPSWHRLCQYDHREEEDDSVDDDKRENDDVGDHYGRCHRLRPSIARKI